MEADRPSSGTAESPRSVLLLEDAGSDAIDRACGELLVGDDPGGTRLLLVTLVDAPSARLAAWDAAADARPARTVAVGMNVGADADDIDLRAISDPSNLTRLGVEITEAMSDLGDDPPAVCFHSVSVLLQYAPVQQVFQFLSVLKSHFADAGANAHFHLDPATHDEQTIATLRPLFDEVVRAGEE
jgi:hypothetical protein